MSPRALPALLLAVAAATIATAAAQQVKVEFRPQDPFPLGYLCKFITAKAVHNNTEACRLVDALSGPLVGLPDDSCPNLQETGFGRQRLPIMRDSKGNKAPVLPLARPPDGPPTVFLGTQRETVLQEEGATYNWLWQTIRNIKLYWPCSKLFGGSLDGYLFPTGWAPVGGTKHVETGLTLPGIYTRPERMQSGLVREVPLMAVMERKGHLVVSLRGSNTKFEWATNFEYNTTAGYHFTSYDGRKDAFAGEVHYGFATGFSKLWNGGLRGVLAANNWASITITGHSQGGALAALLAGAAAVYERDRAAAQKTAPTPISAVVFGNPYVGDRQFITTLHQLVNFRRISFANDPFTLLPCPNAPMPLCSKTIVPTRSHNATVLHTSSYFPYTGQITLQPSDMAGQVKAWELTGHVLLSNPRALVSALHVCSYGCALRRRSGGNARNDTCMLLPGDETELEEHSYCPEFPSTTWPVKALDRQLLTDTKVFPASRPPMFEFRNYSSARSWSCAFDNVGRLTLEIEHAPLPGITPEMMVWHYDNLQSGTAVSPLDNKTYPNFLLFHPRDHIRHWTEYAPEQPVKRLSNPLERRQPRPIAHWQEIQASGCEEVEEEEGSNKQANPRFSGKPAQPYVCPTGPNVTNPGVTNATDRALIYGADQVNSKVLLMGFGPNFIEFGVLNRVWLLRNRHSWAPDFAEHPQSPAATPPPPANRTTAKAAHHGRDRGHAKSGGGLVNGLRVWTKMTVGIGFFKGAFNGRIMQGWSNGMDPLKKCERTAIHTIEEFGTLPLWLPQAYKAHCDRNPGSCGPSKHAPAAPAPAAAPPADAPPVVRATDDKLDSSAEQQEVKKESKKEQKKEQQQEEKKGEVKKEPKKKEQQQEEKESKKESKKEPKKETKERKKEPLKEEQKEREQQQQEEEKDEQPPPDRKSRHEKEKERDREKQRQKEERRKEKEKEKVQRREKDKEREKDKRSPPPEEPAVQEDDDEPPGPEDGDQPRGWQGWGAF